MKNLLKLKALQLYIADLDVQLIQLKVELSVWTMALNNYQSIVDATKLKGRVDQKYLSKLNKIQKAKFEVENAISQGENNMGILETEFNEIKTY